jgi:hypothetical protein
MCRRSHARIQASKADKVRPILATTQGIHLAFTVTWQHVASETHVSVKRVLRQSTAAEFQLTAKDTQLHQPTHNCEPDHALHAQRVALGHRTGLVTGYIHSPDSRGKRALIPGEISCRNLSARVIPERIDLSCWNLAFVPALGSDGACPHHHVHPRDQRSYARSSLRIALA